eukprot:SAG22_NODE_280_length_13084_cov_3.480209_5_plen_134_part_00
MVDFAAYRELHLRIAKTACADFNLAETEQVVLRDWEEDLHAHAPAGHGGESAGRRLQLLSHDRFCDALFMLVSDWSEGAGHAALFIDFLETVFKNICVAGNPDDWHGREKTATRLIVICLHLQRLCLKRPLTL